ncbi:MAG: choice-of-anchor V domain-containing protein, partial [Flavobacteriales bacterium]
ALASKYGFQLSAENALGTKKGTFIPASDTKLAGSNITHNGAFIGSTPQWVFNWTAPASGTGNVVFTTAIIAANGSGNTGDKILTASISISENLSTSVQNTELADFSVFPNPVNENFVLNYSLPNDDKVLISLTDMNGKEIKKMVNENQAAGSHHLILAPEVEAGIYLLKVSVGAKETNHKLIVR